MHDLQKETEGIHEFHKELPLQIRTTRYNSHISNGAYYGKTICYVVSLKQYINLQIELALQFRRKTNIHANKSKC